MWCRARALWASVAALFGNQAKSRLDVVDCPRQVRHELGEKRVITRLAAEDAVAAHVTGRPFDAKERRPLWHPEEIGRASCRERVLYTV